MSDFGSLVKAITDWPARYFFALAAVAGALLVISHSRWADIAGLQAAPDWVRLALTVATLLFSAIGLTKTITSLSTRRADTAAARARGLARENELRDLTPSECAVLARYVDGNVRTASFYVGNSGPTDVVVAAALALRGHLYEVARRDTAVFTQVDYAIQEPTFAFLRKHPELLQSGRRAPRAG